MIVIQGKGVSKGVLKGNLYFYQRTEKKIEKLSADVEAEKARLAEAQQKAIAQLEVLAENCREEAGDETAILFETHAMFVEDEDYVDAITSTMEEEQCNAEYAVMMAGEQFAAMFAAMDDAYMQARAADIKDVTQRLLNNLMGIVEGGIDSEEPVILAADDLAPHYGQYPAYDEALKSRTLADFQLVSYVLGICATVDDVKGQLRQVRVTGVDPRSSTVHWRFTDPSGRQVVLEIVGG